MAVDDIHFRLRLPDELREGIRAIATQNRRSMTAQIVLIIEEWLADHRENEEWAAHAADITDPLSRGEAEHRRVVREQLKDRPRNEVLFTRVPTGDEWDALKRVEQQLATITAALIASNILPKSDAPAPVPKKTAKK